jgi:hypothetical protein
MRRPANSIPTIPVCEMTAAGRKQVASTDNSASTCWSSETLSFFLEPFRTGLPDINVWLATPGRDFLSSGSESFHSSGQENIIAQTMPFFSGSIFTASKTIFDEILQNAFFHLFAVVFLDLIIRRFDENYFTVAG